MLTIDKVQYVYNKLKKLSNKNLEKGNIEKALKYIKTSARVAYVFNIFFKDDEIEDKLKKISDCLLTNQINFMPISGRFVFYDSFGFSNRGLVHQYLRALISWEVEFLYICGSNNKNNAGVILNEIIKYDKADVFFIDSSISKTEQIKTAHRKISEYKPEKAFLYFTPSDVNAIVTFFALPMVERFLINLTDHAFWLGLSCIDYSIEFRNFGCTVSQQKREIPEEKLLLQPFYPIVIPRGYAGLPKVITPEKIIIFSGGGYYKVYGDNNKFFYILKRLLDENSKVVILFAGSGDGRFFKKFINKNGYEKRLFLLGFRRDINEVFANCDIYLGTYPFAGGLMSQYAAINGKPILAYAPLGRTDIKVEEFIFQNDNESNVTVTHHDLELFFIEAKKLIDNKEYRDKIGQSLKNGLISKEQFDSELYNLVISHKNIRKIDTVPVNYKKHTELYLEIENKYQDSFEVTLLSSLKFSSILLFPSILLKFLPKAVFRIQIIRMILNKLKKII